jgi:high-affinity iron transporter
VGFAAALGWTIFRGGQRVSLPRFFAVTTWPILRLAAGLLSTGMGRLQGLGWLPMTPPLWDTSGLLRDHSLVGSFLGRLVGYRARPNALEVGAYGLYVVVAGAIIFGGRRPPARRDPEPATHGAGMTARP